MKNFLLLVVAFVATCAVASAQDTWTVAGQSAILNGGGDWNPAATENDMNDDGDGYFSLTVNDKTLRAGSYEFKVCKNHGWNECYPASNYVLNIATDGVYKIEYLFEASSKDVIAIETKTSDQVEYTYFMKHPWGTGADPDWSWKQLTKTDIEGEYSVVGLYGGIGVNWNTAASDGGSTWVPVADITLEGNPQMGDECTFYLYPTPNLVKIVKDASTAINDINVNSAKTYKTIENGQVIIVKDGVRYNIMGMEL